MSKLRLIDKVSMAMASACMLHCLLLPCLVLVSPVIAGWSADSDSVVHSVLLGVSVPLGGLSLFMGCLRHRSREVAVSAAVGFISLIVSLGAETLLHTHMDYLAVVGSAFLIRAHWVNHKLCKPGCHSSCGGGADASYQDN